MKKRVDVVVGLIKNDAGEVLISKRREGQHLAGLWEFPGGKVNNGEDRVDALYRELFEELDICIDANKTDFLFTVSYDYPEKSVNLHTYFIAGFQGVAKGKESQIIRWVNRGELTAYEFPPANNPIQDYITQRTL